MNDQESTTEVDFDTLARTIIVYHAGERLTLHEHMAKQTKLATAAVMRHGKGASLSFSLTINPSSEEASVDIKASVAVKVPEPIARAVTLYAEKDGALHASDPRQVKSQGMGELAEVTSDRFRERAARGAQQQ